MSQSQNNTQHYRRDRPIDYDVRTEVTLSFVLYNYPTRSREAFCYLVKDIFPEIVTYQCHEEFKRSSYRCKTIVHFPSLKVCDAVWRCKQIMLELNHLPILDRFVRVTLTPEARNALHAVGHRWTFGNGKKGMGTIRTCNTDGIPFLDLALEQKLLEAARRETSLSVF